MTAANLFDTAGWPDTAAHPPKGNKYPTPDGLFPRVTSVCKAFGGGVEGLIKWSANLERGAVLEALGEVVAEGRADSPAEYVQAVESKLGKTRAHQRALEKAGDIGSEIHRRIQWHLARELGQESGPEPKLSEPAAIGFTSWRAWWVSAKLTPYRIEQLVWDKEWGYAGTIDLIARAQDGCPYGTPGVLIAPDWKSAAGIYPAHHMQLAAYVRAANRWEPVEPGPIVWIPKKADGPLEVRPHTLGHLYGGVVVTPEQLLEAFRACLTLHNTFVEEA